MSPIFMLNTGSNIDWSQKQKSVIAAKFSKQPFSSIFHLTPRFTRGTMNVQQDILYLCGAPVELQIFHVAESDWDPSDTPVVSWP